MASSLYAGISGLNASAKQLDVIGNNIANVNTVGFRAGKIQFADILSQSMSGGSSNAMQIGRGVAVSDIATQFSSGSVETTSNATDLSIDGEGFFMVNDGNAGTYYTRAGAFHLDSDGNLVDVNGYTVQGYNLLSANPNTITDISLKDVQSNPEVTTTVSVGANLNSQTDAGRIFNAAQTVYDSLGQAHTLKMEFQKTEANGCWSIRAYLDNNEVNAIDYSGLAFDENGTLESVYGATATETLTTVAGTASVAVDREGQIYRDGALTLTRGATAGGWTIASAEYENAVIASSGVDGVDDLLAIDLDGAGGADITVSLGGTWAAADTIALALDQTATAPVDITMQAAALSNGATIGLSESGANEVTWDLVGADAEALTGFASTSVVKALTHDGYASGVLQSISVQSDGTITGFFTNGQTSSVGQLVLADFSNPSGLQRMGSNLFGETLSSGVAIKNAPGSAGMGELTANSLELSNTDLATEFVNMITAQRAYQASAKVVTTTDTLMSELMNIKR